MSEVPIIGSTGEYPDGKLSEADEGELRCAVFAKGDQVRIEFGKPIAWLSMPYSDAIEFAMTIINAARRGGKGPG